MTESGPNLTPTPLLESDAKLDGQDKTPFGLTIGDLEKLLDPKNKPHLTSLGGSEGLCAKLKVDPSVGLCTDEQFDDFPLPAPTTPLVQPPKWKIMLGLEEPISIDDSGFKHRSAQFGRNVLPQIPQKNVFQLMFEALHDKTLIVLCVAALVSLSVGVYIDLSDPNNTEPHWIEGVAIIIAVIVVVTIQSVNDYKKESQFRRLNAKKDDRQVKVIRNGNPVQISVYDILVGDIVMLEPGDLVNVDGVLISAHNLKGDESSATGESDLIRKVAYAESDECKDPFILSGSKINEGVGKMIVTAVGMNSFFGKTMMGLRIPPEDTPLQVKLDVLAELIAKWGAVVSILLLIILVIKYSISSSINGWADGPTIVADLINFLIQAIVVIVLAVPEGLPLAVTLSLAYGTSRMMKDNNLVRIIAACETMGGATTICSDKTGTLTQNKMTVVAGLVGLKVEFKDESGIKKLDERLKSIFPPGHKGGVPTKDFFMPSVGATELNQLEYVHVLLDGIALNSTAFEHKTDKGSVEIVGNKTETALLEWGIKLGLTDFSLVRFEATNQIVQVYPFSSERKSMSTVVQRYARDQQRFVRVYTKGASEIVMKFCDKIMKYDEADADKLVVQPFGDDSKNSLSRKIKSYADESLRTISLAYRDYSLAEYKGIVGQDLPEPTSKQVVEMPADASAALENHFSKSLTFLCLVGIEDPLRDGVAEAVAKCQNAGVFVRMVTGDNINTARAIATKCGIHTKGGLVMEGIKFRRLNATDMEDVLPRLQVLARSSPTDKQILVQKLKEMGETVAVTGDGTNDGPALKMADVGFSMGIAGTEVAKEASSIILLDDNFASIVKAMMWGRAVNDSVKKFLQFQLTVNVSAVTIAFFSAILTEDNESVLTAVQLLWVNLIMDSLGALALATDPPTEEILDRFPESKRDPLITVNMWKMILGQSAFQITANFVVLFAGPRIFGLDVSQSDQKLRLNTLIFNMFVFLQLFNEFNCRRIDEKLNIFANLSLNPFFVPLMLAIALVQVLIIFFGGPVFETVPIPFSYWVVSILIGALTWPVGVMIRLIPSWDGCTVCGVGIAQPDTSRIIMSKERLQWRHAIGTVQTQLNVFRALRGTERHKDIGHSNVDLEAVSNAGSMASRKSAARIPLNLLNNIGESGDVLQAPTSDIVLLS